MNCYQHPALAAVGMCKNCCKGLCPDCAQDVGNGLACTGHCADAVRQANHLIERSAQVFETEPPPPSSRWADAKFWIILAVGMWAVAAYDYVTEAVVDKGLLIMAGMFSVGVAFTLFGSRR